MTALARNRRQPVDKKPANSPSFEDSMQRLESIVDAMESGDVPLAELLEKFAEGSKLLKVCEQRLKEAELKIEQLTKARDGSATLTSFEQSPEA